MESLHGNQSVISGLNENSGRTVSLDSGSRKSTRCGGFGETPCRLPKQAGFGSLDVPDNSRVVQFTQNKDRLRSEKGVLNDLKFESFEVLPIKLSRSSEFARRSVEHTCTLVATLVERYCNHDKSSPLASLLYKLF